MSYYKACVCGLKPYIASLEHRRRKKHKKFIKEDYKDVDYFIRPEDIEIKLNTDKLQKDYLEDKLIFPTVEELKIKYKKQIEEYKKYNIY